MSVFHILMEISIVVTLLISMLIIAVYVVGGLATYKCLCAVGYAYPWMAWIPVVSGFAVALATNYAEADVLPGVNIPMKVFMFFPLLRLILMFTSGIGCVLMLAIGVLGYGWCYGHLFADLEECVWEDTKLKGYIAGAIPIVAWIIFFQKTKEQPYT